LHFDLRFLLVKAFLFLPFIWFFFKPSQSLLFIDLKGWSKRWGKDLQWVPTIESINIFVLKLESFAFPCHMLTLKSFLLFCTSSTKNTLSLKLAANKFNGRNVFVRYFFIAFIACLLVDFKVYIDIAKSLWEVLVFVREHTLGVFALTNEINSRWCYCVLVLLSFLIKVNLLSSFLGKIHFIWLRLGSWIKFLFMLSLLNHIMVTVLMRFHRAEFILHNEMRRTCFNAILNQCQTKDFVNCWPSLGLYLQTIMN
jgi:hypothetical protein